MSFYDLALKELYSVISALSYLLHVCPIQCERELTHRAGRQDSLRPSSRLVLHAFKLFNSSWKFFILYYCLLVIGIHSFSLY